ncbi:hypothetical protein A8H39_00185 [Paraburkholderia fungorum]|uniref:hypothetical protein n=1 Tax=Paraburkholderia fungorum TaxID=134537 RepID=UPI00047F86A1|nr:hypothetical protein [Paraburkholderia fungorum]MBB5546514.1 hypothetical protein [Paraburkholderia fungorum]PNE59601.1 hypothetical protein A8H39_00185 [Paraburkholderia fungorum]
MNTQTEAVRVKSLRRISEQQRVVVQDVLASPPKLHEGRVVHLWSDGLAAIRFDEENQERDRHLVFNGLVDIHNVAPSL